MRGKTPLTFSPKSVKELTKMAKKHQPQQGWRDRLSMQLMNNPSLMQEFYEMADRNPQRVKVLMQYGANYIRQVAPQLQQAQNRNLSPSHPSVINNINHPLNPSNPRNLMLNPSMNLLFQQDVNTQAAILENEIETTAEIEQAEDLLSEEVLAEEVLADENLQKLAEKGFSPELNPYKELGLKENATKEEIEFACLKNLAEKAPAPGEKPSPAFEKAAAASVLLTDKKHEHLLSEQLPTTHKATAALAA